MTNFVDNAAIIGARVTKDGYLVADCHVARTGVQRYVGVEVGLPEVPYVDIFRPESAVFDSKSLQTYSHIPVTIDHPTCNVTADNWKDLAVGEVSSDVLRDGERLKVPLVLKDARAISAVVGGKRQLSVGYAADVEFEPGVAPDGTPYHAVLRSIRANHVAIVDSGRAGPEFRIGDGNWGAPASEISTPLPGAPAMNTTPQTLRGVLVDGITIQTTDQGAEAISRLQGQVDETARKLGEAVTAHAVALAAKESEIGELKVKVADAEKKIPDSKTLDTLAQARATLIGDAQRLAKDLKVDGLADEAIRRAAVTAVYGADLVKDSSDAEINGMFKAALGSAKRDPVRGALAGALPMGDAAPDNGQAAYEARLRSAWKGQKTA